MYGLYAVEFSFKFSVPSNGCNDHDHDIEGNVKVMVWAEGEQNAKERALALYVDKQIRPDKYEWVSTTTA